MKWSNSFNISKVFGLSVLVGLAGYAIQPTGFVSLTYAEETTIQGVQVQDDQGEVTERGVAPLMRDHRKSSTGTPFAVPPPAKSTAPDPVFGNFRITRFYTDPEKFAPDQHVKTFQVYYLCQPITGPCVEVENVRIEIWHTRPGGKATLVGTSHGQRLSDYTTSQRTRLLAANGWRGAEGFFTVKFLKDTSVLTRVFSVVATQLRVNWAIEGPRDHRENR